MATIRIIAGDLKRRGLKVPSGRLTRPTSSRVRESIFNLISARIEIQGAAVLDLFSGTGALGIEALSRKADDVELVEMNPLVLACSRDSAEALDVDERCTFIRSDVRVFLKRSTVRQYHLILADPPYDLSYLEELPDLVWRHLMDGGLFVLEHDRRTDFSDRTGFESSRAYGRTMVTVFSKNEHANPS